MIIWANLDAEARWAGINLPKAVLERLSALAPLLGALADGPVEVFAPAAVDAARIKLDVTMKSGVPAKFDLAWAQPSAKAANDRRLNQRLHERLGTLLPGQRVITSVDEIDGGKWVCKAPWTAAGRDRAYGAGPPAGDNRIYVTRLLERFGALLYEPWCERLFDVGVCAHTDGRKHAPHTLLSDARGGFVGISLAPPPLSEEEAAQLDRVVEEAREELTREGYRGPFSVDAFVYRPSGGLDSHGHDSHGLDSRGLDAPRLLHAPCEINARYTFGHVAHALATRYGATRLGFGDAPPGAMVLVEGAAWITT